MGTTKIYPYTKKTLELAQTAKGIGHPARHTILKHLLKHHFGTSSIFQDLTQLSKSTVSQHLKELHKSRLIYLDYINGEACVQLHKNARKRIDSLMDSL